MNNTIAVLTEKDKFYRLEFFDSDLKEILFKKGLRSVIIFKEHNDNLHCHIGFSGNSRRITEKKVYLNVIDVIDCFTNKKIYKHDVHIMKMLLDQINKILDEEQ